MGKICLNHKIGSVNKIGRCGVDDFSLIFGCIVEVKVVPVVNLSRLHWENIASQFHLSAERSQEVPKRELRLPFAECSLLRFLTYSLFAVVQIDMHWPCGEHLLENYWINFAN